MKRPGVINESGSDRFAVALFEYECKYIRSSYRDFVNTLLKNCDEECKEMVLYLFEVAGKVYDCIYCKLQRRKEDIDSNISKKKQATRKQIGTPGRKS